VECRINKAAQKLQNLQVLFNNIALSLALTAAAASTKHFDVKE